MRILLTGVARACLAFRSYGLPDPLARWSQPISLRAEQQASVLLAGLGDRWTHVHGVAVQAGQVSAVLVPKERPDLVAAAWLHDIGYARALNRLGFHPLDGARYVRRQGHERLAGLVAYHSGARFEAEERGLADALAEFAPEDGPLLDALTYADMTTGPAGQRVLLEARIAEILERYPAEDPVHRAISRAGPALRAAVDRTQERLAAAADQPGSAFTTFATRLSPSGSQLVPIPKRLPPGPDIPRSASPSTAMATSTGRRTRC